MIDPSLPLRDTIAELDRLRAEVQQYRQNVKNIAVCLAISQIQNGPVGYAYDSNLAARLMEANLSLRWDAPNGAGQLIVSLEGHATPLVRADIVAVPEVAEGLLFRQGIGKTIGAQEPLLVMPEPAYEPATEYQPLEVVRAETEKETAPAAS